MTLKTTLLAATAAVALSAVASNAATVNGGFITDGGATTIDAGDNILFNFNVAGDDADRRFEHTFTVENAGTGSAAVTVLGSILNLFGGTNISFEALGSVVASTPVAIGTTTLDTTFSSAAPSSLTQTFVISWSNNLLGSPAIFDGEIVLTAEAGEEPAPIPLPAGILLLGTALGGLGLARRRKKA